MDIKGINSITTEELARELGRGAKFVIYQYSISILILSSSGHRTFTSCGRTKAPF
jgi:hypothetical protein